MPVIIHNSLSTTNRRGIALLMVLMIVLAITIMSAGFLVRTDSELACGRNMAIRIQMDQLADSALEHARRLILHPHDVPGTYWEGGTFFQLVADSRDYYDVSVTRDATDYCTYDIACEAYRFTGTEKVGRSRLSAELRLDPCIAVWAGADLVQRPLWTCEGDLRSAGSVTNLGLIGGDVHAASLSGPAGCGGQQYTLDPCGVAWPDPTPMDFVMQFGAVPLTPGTMSSTTFGPYNPARPGYCNGNLILAGNVTIDGMLLVDGNLTIQGTQNEILSAKNMPALYVTGDLTIRAASDLKIDGLVIVDGDVFIRADCTSVAITGALFVGGRILETAMDTSVQGNDAVVYGPAVWRPGDGQVGPGAMEFDGAGGHLRTPDSATRLQIINDYTLCVWVKPEVAQNRFAGIISRCNPAGTENHWTFQFDGSGNALRICHFSNIWNAGLVCAQVADGPWHHLAIVREGNDMRTYLDGTLVHSGTLAAAPGTGDGHLNIGADMTGSADYVYTGLLDDVRVYDGALTQPQIQNVINNAPIMAVPIGHWKLDESGSQLTVTPEPARAAVILPAEGAGPFITQEHWSPAGGAFFRSIRRTVP